jgi:hypothetical protein
MRSSALSNNIAQLKALSFKDKMAQKMRRNYARCAAKIGAKKKWARGA